MNGDYKLPLVTTWFYSVSKNWDVLYDKFYLPFYIFNYSEYNIMANFITLSKCRKQIHGYNMKFKHSPRLLLFDFVVYELLPSNVLVSLIYYSSFLFSVCIFIFNNNSFIIAPLFLLFNVFVSIYQCNLLVTATCTILCS